MFRYSLLAIVSLFFGLTVCLYNRKLNPEDFDVECTKGGFHVSIPKEKSGDVVFRFIDASCTASDNTTHWIASAAYGECGTVKRNLDDGVEFTNELLNAEHNLGTDDIEPDAEEHCPHLELKITCFHTLPDYVVTLNNRERFRRSTIKSGIKRTNGCKKQYALDEPDLDEPDSRPLKIITCPFLIGTGEEVRPDGVLTSSYVGRKIKVKGGNSPCRPLQQRGSVHLTMNIFSDNTYTSAYQSNPDRTPADWYEDVHYQVSHLSGHTNFKMVPLTCYATPDPNPNNDMSYYFISEGCPVDPTVKFYPSSDGSSRFSITSFQFQNSNSRSFYTHCQMLVCDNDDLSEQCNKQCQKEQPGNSIKPIKRKRRDIVKQIVNDKEVDVTCLADRMTIRIKKISQNEFHLNDENCKAKQDNGYIILTTKYRECGTKLLTDKDTVYFSNVVTERVPGKNQIIRGPLLKKTIFCAYKKKSVTTQIRIKSNRKRLRAAGVGTYKVQIDMYDDDKFLTKNKKSTVEISESKNMFFEVKVKSAPFKGNLELHLDTCLGYNQPKVGTDRKVHIFIKDGCPYRDETVKFYETRDASKVRFSVKPFKFGTDTSIMINCFVTACSINDKDSKCKKMQRVNSKQFCQ